MRNGRTIRTSRDIGGDEDLSLPSDLAINSLAEEGSSQGENKPKRYQSASKNETRGSAEPAARTSRRDNEADSSTDNFKPSGPNSKEEYSSEKPMTEGEANVGARASTRASVSDSADSTANNTNFENAPKTTTRRSSSSPSKTIPKRKTTRKKADSVEERLRKLSRFVLLFCGVLLVLSLVVMMFWSRVVGTNQEADFNRIAEVRDPAFFLSNGHYTENNLRLNIMPQRLAGKKLPLVYSKDVTLERVTVGPGSVVTHYFSISAEQAKRQTPEGVAANLCASKILRKELIDMVDEYRLIYSSGGRKLYRITLTSASCDSH